MRTLHNNELLTISGGNVITDAKHYLSNGFTHPEKTLAIASLSTGLVLGSFVPFASLIGIGAFAAWAAYDLVGSNITIPFINSGGATNMSETAAD